jgi:hypothetical protein
MLSNNKTFIYQAHPKLHHQNPMPQPGQTQCSQTRHSSTNIIPSSHHQNPMPQSGQSNNSSQSNKRESISQAHPKLHHQKPNTTNPTPPSLMTPKKQIPSSQLVM